MDISEKHVQAIWYDAQLRPSNLITRRGSEVRVISPGEWNLSAGPDFRNAVLEIGKERRRITGDVEVHICPADWDLHGHGADERYRNVIAHITWRGGPDPKTLPPGAITIWLGRMLTCDPKFDPESIDLEAYPYSKFPLERRPCEKRLSPDPELAQMVLTTAGRWRMKMKARRLSGRLSAGRDRRQVFYEEVMTAFGYSRNSEGFRGVAERIPIAQLPRETEPAKTALLTAASFENWDYTGVRPWNSPERRLSSAAGILTKTPLLEYADCTDFSERECRKLIKEMCTVSGVRLLGKGRAAAILANVVVPWAISEGRIKEAPEWLPPEDVSSPVRLTASRMFGRDHNAAVVYAGNGLHIQGLIQIHREYCQKLHPECHHCRVAVGEADLIKKASLTLTRF